MSKKLSAEIVLQRTKAGNLNNVKNLNLWGNEITDVTLLDQMPNIEIVSLSVNKIYSLESFAQCPNLREIYLRKNCIEDLSEIRHLASLSQLSVLWLWDNPCAEHPEYRAHIISLLPNLVKLDNQPITDEERSEAAKKPSREVLAEIPKQAPRGPCQNKKPLFQKREVAKTGNKSRNDNILCAVLALLKELDSQALGMVSREVEKRLSG